MSASSSDCSFDDTVVVGPQDVADFNEANILPLTAEDQEAIRRWLQPTAFEAENGELRKHLSSHMVGTGDWLWESAPLRKWHGDDDHGMIWLKGIPGSGKSVVAGSLIHKLSKENVPVMFFFFRQIIDANHAPVALLRDWLSQMLSYSPPLQARLKEHLERRRELESISMSDLWSHLRLGLATISKAYCIVDALDEMDMGDDYEDFLQELVKLGQWRPSSIKVAVTSRPVIHVERPFRDKPMLQMRLEEKMVDIDIATYVESRLLSSAIPRTQHNEIKQAVPGKANGLFLYAKLAMDAFLKEGADVEEVLATLPADLNVMYMNLLREHAKRSGVPEELQLLILSWATHASRPLRLIEIAEMLRFTRDVGPIADLKGTKDHVRSACGPLLELLPNETISVVHHSLTEFLNGSSRKVSTAATRGDHASYPILDKATTHARLARACISYLLNSGCLDKVKVQLDDGGDYDPFGMPWKPSHARVLKFNETLYKEYNFLAYSTKNLQVHIQKVEQCGSIPSGLLGDLEKLFSGSSFTAFVMLIDHAKLPTTPLHMAAGLGLTSLAAKLIKDGNMDINALDARKETPLLAAAAAGHAAIVKDLLASDAKPDEASGSDGLKALHHAANKDYAEIVDLLLDAGVSPLTPKTRENPGRRCGNAPTSVGQTPLMYATLYRHQNAAKAFIPHLKDSKMVSSGLAWAATSGSCEIVEAFLGHPLVDVNAKFRGDTPLFLAACKGHIKSVVLLLKSRADPAIFSWGADDEYGSRNQAQRGTPNFSWFGVKGSESGVKVGFNSLHALCGALYRDRWGDELPAMELSDADECISLMLEAGLDINERDESGNTALFHAVAKSFSLVQALLKAGIDANLNALDGSTALHKCKDHEIARLLVIEGGVEVDKPRLSDGKTPFLVAATKATSSIVEQYAELGADLRMTDNKGQGALHLFLGGLKERYDEEEWQRTMKSLLAAGMSPNLQDHEGKTPLHMENALKSKALVSLMVEGGADINTRDHKGKTPLFDLVTDIREYDLKETLNTLDFLTSEEIGARLNVRDYNGQTLLFYCVSNRILPNLISYLVDHGMDLQARDNAGNTIWHTAIHSYKNDESMSNQALLELDLDATNHAGQSALHSLCARGYCFLDSKISLFKRIDCKDNDGIRPLHIAARELPEHVETLLKQGASPTEPTYEGITPLHVAARFRKPAIVRLLLDAVERSKGKKELSRFLNTPHRSSTPLVLQFACQSGIPETVALLLAAGANPNPVYTGASPALLSCARYGAEERLWREYDVTRLLETRSLGIKLDDPTRGRVDVELHYSRLEEILDMLYDYEITNGSAERYLRALDGTILNKKCDDYTRDCLLQVRQRLVTDKLQHVTAGEERIKPSDTDEYVRELWSCPGDTTFKISHDILSGVSGFAASRRSLIQNMPWKDLPRWCYDSENIVDQLLPSLLRNHQWKAIQCMFEDRPDLIKPYHGGKSVLSRLIEKGLENLIRDVLTHKTLKGIDDTYNLIWDSDDVNAKWPFDPPLVTACQRKEDNMSILRLLVDSLGVNIDQQRLVCKGWDKDRKVAKGGSPLHELASGGHWWQATKGIPFLIERGADLELRDDEGKTPLLRALGGDGHRPLAARMLIESGADVNASSGGGVVTCLSLASRNLELTKLLVEKGAVITAEALFESIRAGNAGIVEALSSRCDLTMRRSPSRKEHIHGWNVPCVQEEEQYPLYAAAYPQNLYDTDLVQWSTPLVQVLLRHGANPFAQYSKCFRNMDSNAGSEQNDFIHVETTLLHDIIESGGVVEPFFELQDLDLEHRDALGRTLLLAACDCKMGPDCSMDVVRNSDKKKWKDTGKPGRAKFLLERGARATALDNNGQNALHHIFKLEVGESQETLQLLLDRAGSELVNQQDASGETPLHYALRQIPQYYTGADTQKIELLLDHGADVHVPDAQGNSSLHLLATRLARGGIISDQPDSSRKLFQHFLSLGLPVNGRNHQGETPLFRFLAGHGGNRRLSQDKGENKRQKAVLQTFLDAGADVFIPNNIGDTLLHAVAATDGERQNGEDGDLMIARFKWLLEQGLDLMTENRGVSKNKKEFRILWKPCMVLVKACLDKELDVMIS
ncbi:Ankyrin-3 [Paramyrothecium foliicola]|nr:Ankyrin-3 [Paramyrothecium foliicola]